MFDSYQNSDDEEILLHETTVKQLDKNGFPLFMNKRGIPECSRGTTAVREFENVLENRIVYFRYTYHYKEVGSEEVSLYFGKIWGGYEPNVYLGLGTEQELKDRVQDYKEFKLEDETV